jgi:hypothetical protein
VPVLSELAVSLAAVRQQSDPFASLMKRQYGVLSRNQALDAGLSLRQLNYRIRPGGPWQRLLPGVYLTVTGTPTADQLDMAALLHAGKYCMITGLAALRRHSVRVQPTQMVDVLVPAASRRASRDYVRLHRTRRWPPMVAYNCSIEFALVPRAAIDAAIGMQDIRAVRGLLAGVVQQQRCSVSELAAELGNSRERCTGLIRSVLGEVAGGMMSAPEGDLMDLVTRARLPVPMYNPWLYLGETFLARPDAWWPEAGVAGEVDSREWHLSPADWERTMSRHDRMTAAGIRVLHFSPAQLRSRPDEVVELVRSALSTGSPVPAIRTVPATG